MHLLGRNGLAKIVAPGVRAPPQGVDDTDVGQPEGVADQAVLAGAAAGAQRGQPGDGGGREPDLQRLASQAGQHGCVGGVRVEQFGAKPVDQQHARPGDVTG